MQQVPGVLDFDPILTRSLVTLAAGLVLIAVGLLIDPPLAVARLVAARRR